MKTLYAFLFAHLIASVAISQNLVLNGHMEQGADSEWSDEVNGGASATFSSSSDAASGAFSKQIVVSAAGTDNFNVQTRQTVEINAGSIYRLSFWAKASASLDMVVSIQQTGGSFDSFIFQPVTLSADWQQYSFSGVSSIASSTQEIAAQFQMGTSAGTFFIDDVEVREVGLLNGDFEEGVSTAWFTGAGDGGVTYTDETGTTNVSEGTQSIRILSPATSANVSDAQLATNFGTQEVVSGSLYRVSFEAKSAAALATETIQLALQNASDFSGADTGDGSFTQFSPTTDFERYDQYFTSSFTTGGTNKLQVAFQVGSTVGTIFLDDVKVEQATAWTGATDSDWSKISNWSNGIPTANTFVRIPNVTNQPTLDNLTAVVSGLDIEPSAVLTMEFGTLIVDGEAQHEGSIVMDFQSSVSFQGDRYGNGTIDYNRVYRFSDGRYSMVGSPVVGASTSDLGSFAFKYDESVPFGANGGFDRFIDVTSGETMPSGVGYFTAGSASTLFSGVPHHGDQRVSLSFTSGAEEGFNLVANPYPSVVDAQYFLQANTGTTGALYIWDDNGSNTERGTNDDYFIVNSLGVVGSGADSTTTNSGNWDGFIRVGQGFFVQTTSASNEVIFSDGMKASQINSSGGQFRVANSEDTTEKLKITLKSSDNSYTETLFGVVEGASTGMDRGLDAVKLGDQELQVFSLLEGKKLAIQATGSKADPVPIGVSVPQAGEYTFAFSGNLTDAYLYDEQSNESQMIESGKPLIFSVEEGSTLDRFQIQFSPIDEILSVRESANWYLEKEHIYFRNMNFPMEVKVYSLRGQLLKSAYLKESPEGVNLREFIDRPVLIKGGEVNVKLLIY